LNLKKFTHTFQPSLHLFLHGPKSAKLVYIFDPSRLSMLWCTRVSKRNNMWNIKRALERRYRIYVVLKFLMQFGSPSLRNWGYDFAPWNERGNIW